MPTIKQSLINVTQPDKGFAGTVAFRNEKLCLPDGSKVAIGIDGERWVIVYQKAPKAPFVMYEYSAQKNTVIVDKSQGSAEDINKVRELINYFMENAQVDDLVTIEAAGGQEN